MVQSYDNQSRVKNDFDYVDHGGPLSWGRSQSASFLERSSAAFYLKGDRVRDLEIPEERTAPTRASATLRAYQVETGGRGQQAPAKGPVLTIKDQSQFYLA